MVDSNVHILIYESDIGSIFPLSTWKGDSAIIHNYHKIYFYVISLFDNVYIEIHFLP